MSLFAITADELSAHFENQQVPASYAGERIRWATAVMFQVFYMIISIVNFIIDRFSLIWFKYFYVY